MSPMRTRDERRVYDRTRQKENRLWWLEQHPCSCGQPSVRIRGQSGAIPRVWSFSRDAIAEDLKDVGIDYFCGDCWYRQVSSTRRQRDLDSRKDNRKFNRQAWLAAHKCDCGKRPVTMRGKNGDLLPQGVWACSQATIDEKLGPLSIAYYCEDCRAQLAVARNERRCARIKEERARERLYREVIPKQRVPREPRTRVVQPKVRTSQPKIPTKRESPTPLFAEKHRCPDCGDEFPRYALLSRHQREGCAA